MPVDVDFIDFETARSGDLSRYKVIINAGKAGDAWSGGDNWKDVKVVEAITKWVYEGGCFIGIGEPSATSGYDTFFRLAQVLGVDEDKMCIRDRVGTARIPYGGMKMENIL